MARGSVDVLENLLDGFLVGRFQVRYVHGNPGAPADLDRLFQGGGDPLSVSHVGDVEASLLRHDLARLHELVCGGEALGDVVEPGGDADRSLDHAALDLPPDQGHLKVVGGAAAEAAGHAADIGVRDVGNGILHVRPVDAVHVLPQALPAVVLAVRQRVKRFHIKYPLRCGIAVDRGVGDAVGHDDLGGEPLGGLGLQVGGLQQPAVGVVVGVDESGGDDPARSVDAVSACGSGKVSDFGDAVAGDEDVRPEARGARPVDDGAVEYGDFCHGVAGICRPAVSDSGSSS